MCGIKAQSCGKRFRMCGTGIRNCGKASPICGIQFGNCGNQIRICGIKTQSCGIRTQSWFSEPQARWGGRQTWRGERTREPGPTRDLRLAGTLAPPTRSNAEIRQIPEGFRKLAGDDISGNPPENPARPGRGGGNMPIRTDGGHGHIFPRPIRGARCRGGRWSGGGYPRLISASPPGCEFARLHVRKPSAEGAKWDNPA